MERDDKKRRRRGILFASVSALMLAIAFFVTLMPGKVKDVPAMRTENATEASKNALDVFLTEREQIREMEMAQLNNIISSAQTGEEMRAAAQRQLMELCEFMEKEVTIEGVLRSRGYKEAVATVHTDSVNILLKASSITKEDTAAILSLVMQETGVSGGNIKIIPVN